MTTPVQTEDTKEATIKPSGLGHTFRSFSHRSFRLYFLGQFVSLTGTWMQSLAMSWLVYRMTNSAMLLGVVEFANLSPVLFFALFGGFAADHYSRKRILLCTNIAAMVQAGILAYLTLTGQVQVWQIITLAALAGTINAFEIPARQALIVNMVERKDLVNAISLNSSLFNGTRVIGPALAALLVQWQGEGSCFLVNACSYSAALLAFIRLPDVLPKKDAGDTGEKLSPADSIKAGLAHAFMRRDSRRLLVFTALLAMFGGQFTLLLPVMAKDVLHQGVGGFGALRSMAAVGSVAAALFLASRGTPSTLWRRIGLANLILACALAGFSASSDFGMACTLVLVLGFCMTFQLSGSHSLLQLGVPDHMRGRLMSVWTMMIMGMTPVGSLMVGWAANSWGAPPALAIASAICACCALAYLATLTIEPTCKNDLDESAGAAKA